MRMMRKVSFSSGHRYWVPALTEVENRELFGEWASPFNHGHNYVFEVTVEGPTDPVTGMIVNIKRIDDVLKAEVVRAFDGKSINDEIAFFHSNASSLENIIRYLHGVITVTPLPGDVRVTHLRLEEMPTLWAEWGGGQPMVSLTRTYEFAASHRLHSPLLSEAENIFLYGKCNNLAGHGHNYVLEVTVRGIPDARTGMIVDLTKLDEIVERTVVNRYDHKNLDIDIAEFMGRVTTSEVVSQEIFNRLVGAVPAELERVRLWETARNMFEVTSAT